MPRSVFPGSRSVWPIEGEAFSWITFRLHRIGYTLYGKACLSLEGSLYRLSITMEPLQTVRASKTEMQERSWCSVIECHLYPQ
ncbi:hypothetical protein V1477_016133 [Vespula maculifrons]|uniref:Uncharacterized protein n=1 Tax=Vespula maculifrons TaxID=7453 RepID=A0ABD2BC73_VESMC